MLTKKDKHLAAAQKFLERGQEERALEEFARVVQEDANDTRTWLKMAEIHARRGALEQARDIYLRTAEIYVEQGFPRKAMTVYKSVLKLTPGLPHVRERLADTYRQQGMVADALRELELAADELQRAGKSRRRCRRCARSSGCTPTTSRSRIRLAETASQVGKVDEAVHELSQLAVQVKAQGRADDFVRVAERLLFHRPEDFGVARELAAAYIARRNPRLALAKLQAALKAAPRDPAERHAAGRGAGAAGSAQGDLGVARAGRAARRRRPHRTIATPRCARRWRWTRPTARHASWRRAGACAVSAVERAHRRRPRCPPAPRGAARCPAREACPRRRIAPGRCRALPGVGICRRRGALRPDAGARRRSGACWRRPTCS